MPAGLPPDSEGLSGDQIAKAFTTLLNSKLYVIAETVPNLGEKADLDSPGPVAG